MIGTRTPFRISFAGGGSDLRSFYSRQPGCVLSTSINKYMYILVHPYFDRKIQVKYSRVELVDRAEQIQHPIVRIALGRFGIEGVDINSIADIPAGTGLGSSCSFTVGLLERAVCLCGEVRLQGGARPGRLRHRDREPRRAHRQAGHLRRRLRRTEH